MACTKNTNCIEEDCFEVNAHSVVADSHHFCYTVNEHTMNAQGDSFRKVSMCVSLEVTIWDVKFALIHLVCARASPVKKMCELKGVDHGLTRSGMKQINVSSSMERCRRR